MRHQRRLRPPPWRWKRPVVGLRGVSIAPASSKSTRRSSSETFVTRTRTRSPAEGPVLARIPIKAFREKRRLPNIHPSLYRDLYANYAETFPPNLYTHYQPTDGRDAARYLGDRSLWQKD